MTVSRRRLLAASLPAGLGLAAPAAWFVPAALAAPGGTAFVMNSASASISLIDMASRREIRRLPVLRQPHHWALTPDARTLLVGDAAGNALFFLDPASGRMLGHRRFPDPYQIWFSPNGRFLVTAALRLNRIYIYEPGTFRLLKRFDVASMPSHIAFAPDSSMVYLSLQGTDRLAAIDLTALVLRWLAPIGPAPAGVMWHRGRLLVGDMGADYVAVADPVGGRVLARIPTGRGAHALFLDPAGRTIYVGNRIAGTVTAINAADLRPIRRYPVPGGPDCMGFAPDGHIWMTLRWAEHVAILDPLSGRYDTILVGRSPHGLFLNNSPSLASRQGEMLNSA